MKCREVEDRVQCQIFFTHQRPGETRVFVEACYKALPRWSSSRQSNESTVDSPCTSLELTIWNLKKTRAGRRCGNSADLQKTQESKRLLGFRTETQLRNHRGALPRRWAVPSAHARTKKDTRNPKWKNLTEEQIRKDLRDVFWRKGLPQRSIRRSYNPTNEEAATP